MLFESTDSPIGSSPCMRENARRGDLLHEDDSDGTGARPRSQASVSSANHAVNKGFRLCSSPRHRLECRFGLDLREPREVENRQIDAEVAP